MSNFAIIENGIVVNVAVADLPQSDSWIQSDTASIGDSYVNSEFIRPGPTPETDRRIVYTISNEHVSINSNSATQYAGNYYCEPGDSIQLTGSITDSNGDVVTSITVPITLKMPLVRHANAQPTTDEIYLNVTLQSGIMIATGSIPNSGDWKILTERTNQALQRIGAEWALSHPDVTFLV